MLIPCWSNITCNLSELLGVWKKKIVAFMEFTLILFSLLSE